MNNQQFRRLLLSDQSQQPQKQQNGAATPAAARTPGSVLGARKQSSIPMTPRQVGRGAAHADFARQLAERNAQGKPAPKTRNTAPKGTRLAAGYTDRTKQRGDEADSDLAQRIKNLEDAMKLGQIDRDTFEKLVLELSGGDVGTTHLVKGLDRKLLERVRRGEDVLRDPTSADNAPPDDASADDAGAGSDVEDAFDELAQADVGPVTHTKVEKKGAKMVAPPPPPPPVAGVKRTRADILAELKRQREEAARIAAEEHEKKYPTLGPGFRKVDPKGESARIEIDANGREILIVTGPDGKEKRKVRKQKVDEQPLPELRNDLDDASKPINMHNLPPPREEHREEENGSDDDDIFEGVGSNYNPLASLGDEDDDDESEDEGEEEEVEKAKAKEPSQSAPASSSTPETTHGPTDTSPKLSQPVQAAKRNYFKSTATTATPSDISTADAAVRAALVKVRNLDEKSTLLQDLSTDPNDPSAKEARLKKRAAELAASDRDMEDMDLGFGESRFDDADEMEREGEKVKFSEWKGLGAGEADEEGEGGARDAKKRKRGPKKRKGDKNNPDDILQAMERQKEKKTKTLG